MARRIDGQRIEHLVAAEARDHAALLAAIGTVGVLDDAGRGEVEGPAARGRRLDHVERLAVGREAAAVGPLQREDLLLDLRAVGLGVVDGAAIVVALARLAEIGEPEAAGIVEHQVVGAVQLPAVAGVVERLELAGLGIDHLDRAALVVGRRRAREQPAVGPLDPVEAAVVGHVDLALGPHGGAVRAAAQLGDDVLLAVGHDAGQRLARDLDQDHRAVGHGDGAFREFQARGDLLVRRRHGRLSLYLPLKAGLRLARKAATPSLKSSLRPSSRWKSRSTSSCWPRSFRWRGSSPP